MYLKAFIQSFLLSMGLFLVNLGLAQLLGKPSWDQLLLVHSILFALTFGGFSLLLLVNQVDPNKIGFTFLAVSTIKLFVSLSIILVLVKVLNRPSEIALHFAGMYFLYLVFLAFKTYILLNKQK